MSKSSQFFRQIPFILAIFCLFAASTASARQQLHGHVQAAIATAPLIGDVADTEPFYLAIGLPLRNQEELRNLIQNLYDPKSFQYHHFLTPEQFTSMYEPTPEDYQKLIDFAQSNGLTVAGTTPNRLILNVSATAANIRRVFHVNLHYYQRPDGTKFYAPDSEPSVDLDLPLLHVSGLDNYPVPHSLAHKGVLNQNPFINPLNGKINQNSGTGPRFGTIYPYYGFDYRNIYLGPAFANTGSGQNIALFELDDYILSNITTYESQTTISSTYSPTVTKVVVGPGFPSPGSGELEVELDIEMAISMAPSANVYVYETNPPGGSFDTDVDNLLNAIANPGANPLCYQISSSWTWDDVVDPTLQAIFLKYAADGQSFFQAAGDSGAYIAADPDQTVPMPINETSMMTVVGGTELSTNGTGGSLGTYSGETAWNNPAEKVPPAQTATPQPGGYYGAGSGGICSNLTIPSYQTAFVTIPNEGSASKRNIPDVSMSSDYIGAYSEGAYLYVDGTSAAAPLWAGLMAVINSQAATQSKGPIGLANTELYNLSTDFNNIPVGTNNNYWGTSTTYPTENGYNLATG
jgi:subtilase family serine protease